MDLVIDFINTISEKPDLAIPVLAVAAVLAVLWIVFSQNCKTFTQRITHKRNRLTSIIIVLVFLFLILIAVDTIHFHINFFWWITVVIWIAAIVTACHDMKPMLFITGTGKSVYHHRFLRYYAEELGCGKIDGCDRVLADGEGKGSLRERKNRWLCKHPLFLDNDAKIQAAFLLCRLFLLKDDVEGAYGILHSLDQSQFYSEEWAEVLVKKAQCLAWMGNISTAKTALQLAGIDGDVLNQNMQGLMTSPETWMTLAFISELSGEFDKAYDYAIKAKDFVELSNLSEERKAVILNDCARYEIIHDSRMEADKDINNAWKHIQKSNSATREAIAVNLIRVMLDYGYSEKKVLSAFEEYRAIHNHGSISSDIDFFNINVSTLRQFGKKEECYKRIKKFYEDIVPKLEDSKGQLECVKAAVFHQLMDGEYDYTWMDKDITAEPDYYADINVYDRTFIFKHYYEILSQLRYKYVRLRKPYADLYETITCYYNGTSNVLGSAADDIDEELKNMKEYNTFRHIDLMNRKLFILSVRDKEQHIRKNLNIYTDLKRYMFNQGLKVEAINTGVQMVTDASSQNNIPMTNKKTGQTILYYEFVNNALVLFPRVEGIFIRYEDIPLGPWEISGVPECIDLIREYTQKAILEIRELQNHPAKAEISIKLLKPCLAMGMDEEAKELYSYATKRGRSEDTLASWARILLRDARKQLNIGT